MADPFNNVAFDVYGPVLDFPKLLVECGKGFNVLCIGVLAHLVSTTLIDRGMKSKEDRAWHQTLSFLFAEITTYTRALQHLNQESA